jgi:hypothetical protein
MATNAELLTLIDAAIEARLTGGAVDEYTIDGVSVKKSPLNELYSLREKLRKEIAMGSQHGVQFVDLRGYRG